MERRRAKKGRDRIERGDRSPAPSSSGVMAWRQSGEGEKESTVTPRPGFSDLLIRGFRRVYIARKQKKACFFLSERGVSPDAREMKI